MGIHASVPITNPLNPTADDRRRMHEYSDGFAVRWKQHHPDGESEVRKEEVYFTFEEALTRWKAIRNMSMVPAEDEFYDVVFWEIEIWGCWFD